MGGTAIQHLWKIQFLYIDLGASIKSSKVENVGTIIFIETDIKYSYSYCLIFA